MSQMFVTEFNKSEAAVQHDLLARLYHEIGLSAVAAALDVMNAPSLSALQPPPRPQPIRVIFPPSCGRTISRPKASAATIREAA